MRVLIVSQYFPPEAGATQNRIGTFVDGMAARGHKVTVVCEQPCHPGGRFHPGYGHRPVMTERRDGVTVHRLLVAASPVKSTARRLAFYGTFAGGAAALVAALPRHDVMFASTPPLPGVLAVAAAAKARRTPFVIDVRDIWPAAAEALGELSNPRVLAVFERAERWLYRAATRVTATTRPFCRHIDEVAGAPVSVHLPNGALDELVARPAVEPPPAPPFVVGYAGNLGIAQGLGIVLEAATELRHEGVRFRLVGDGPLAAGLRAEVVARKLSGVVELSPPVPVAEVGDVLESYHALLIPLRDHPLLSDFIPSKLYDAMAVGRPALVAARGEAVELVEATNAGVALPPEDGPALAAAIRRLRDDPRAAAAMGERGKQAARTLARSAQVDTLAETLAAACAA